MNYCGRHFGPSEIERIRGLLAAEPRASRYRLSVMVCELLDWRRADGRPKDMTCRVALLKMKADGLIELPAAKRAKPIATGVHASVADMVGEPKSLPIVDLDHLEVSVVTKGHASHLWNAYVERHHYLGHRLIPGAQLRYFVRAGDDVVALLSFGASAWKTKPRDDFIGWTQEQRRRNLHLVVNNARFLILPWIKRQNLASRVLSLVSRRIRDDWQARYSYRPVLLETFVDDGRFRGTCYQAANWQCLGKTRGRGKLDRGHQYALPVKTVWTLPLVRNFRQHLCN